MDFNKENYEKDQLKLYNFLKETEQKFKLKFSNFYNCVNVKIKELLVKNEKLQTSIKKWKNNSKNVFFLKYNK